MRNDADDAFPAVCVIFDVQGYEVSNMTFAIIDVACTASQLARFLTNFSPWHIAAADQYIQYLYHTRYFAIVYEGSIDNIVIASDASFADDQDTCRSSQGLVVMMYGGPVLWKAGL